MSGTNKCQPSLWAGSKKGQRHPVLSCPLLSSPVLSCPLLCCVLKLSWEVDRSSWRTAWEQRQEIAAHRWPSTAPTAPSSPWTGEEDLRSMGRWASVLNLGIVKRCETHPTGYPSDIQQNREPVLKQPSFESCGNVFSWVGMSWHENLTDLRS